MIKSILTAAAVMFVSVPAAFSATPATAIASADTPYGKFSCLERAKNKYYALNATSISYSSGGSSIWGYVGNSTVGVWCRGPEAIIVVADGNASTLRDEIKTAF